MLRSAFRAFLLRAGCQPGNTGNALPLDDTTVPDPIDRNDPTTATLCHFLQNNFSYFQENVLHYIGGWIIKKAVARGLCDICCEAMSDPTCSSPSAYLTTVKDFGYLHYASEDLVKLLACTEKLVRGSASFATVMRLVLERYGRMGSLFSGHISHFREESVSLQSHYYSLIRFAVETFYDLRMYSIAKDSNIKKSRVRNALTKKILFLHQ